MSYQVHVWIDKEIIRDIWLNHLEQGVYDESVRAEAAETLLQTQLSSEVNRATTKESSIESSISALQSTLEAEISAAISGLDWKESVATYADIVTTYPNPEDGWTVNVKDTDYTYRYDGTDWVLISANAIPNASQSVNGLMTSTDKTKLDGIQTGATATSFTRTLTTGTKIGTITINGTDIDLYAPSGGGGGGSTVSVTPVLTAGTKLATITVDNVDTDLYCVPITQSEWDTIETLL